MFFPPFPLHQKVVVPSTSSGVLYSSWGVNSPDASVGFHQRIYSELEENSAVFPLIVWFHMFMGGLHPPQSWPLHCHKCCPPPISKIIIIIWNNEHNPLVFVCLFTYPYIFNSHPPLPQPIRNNNMLQKRGLVNTSLCLKLEIFMDSWVEMMQSIDQFLIVSTIAYVLCFMPGRCTPIFIPVPLLDQCK